MKQKGHCFEVRGVSWRGAVAEILRCNNRECLRRTNVVLSMLNRRFDRPESVRLECLTRSRICSKPSRI